MRNMRCELIGPGILDYYIYNPYAVLTVEWFILLVCKFCKHFEDKRGIYVIYCDMGVNSMIVGNNLATMGYRTKSLVGGISGYKGSGITSLQ